MYSTLTKQLVNSLLNNEKQRKFFYNVIFVLYYKYLSAVNFAYKVNGQSTNTQWNFS